MGSKKLAIIGGGASGLFCVANLASPVRAGKLSITIFEQLDRPLKKLLATGGGRCNLTNFMVDNRQLAKQYPRGEKFLYSVFSRFSVQQTLDWFKERKVSFYIDPENCVFPKSDSATTISECILSELNRLRVSLRTNTKVETITQENGKFCINFNDNAEKFDYVLICTGGKKSIVKDKTDLSGYEIAKSLGHNVIKPAHALTSFNVKDKNISNLAGITLKNARISAKFQQKIVASHTGDLLFTHKGISGPAALNLSSKIVETGLSPDNPLELIVSVRDFKDLQQADSCLLKEFSEQPNKNIATIVKEFWPANLGRYILEENNIDPEKKTNSITKEERRIIAKSLIGVRFQATDLNEKAAMVTAGGVELKEVDARTMQSKLVPGVFFAGEILNVDGFCGGFNLQFAWSSGYIAAAAICEVIQKG